MAKAVSRNKSLTCPAAQNTMGWLPEQQGETKELAGRLARHLGAERESDEQGVEARTLRDDFTRRGDNDASKLNFVLAAGLCISLAAL